LKSSEFEEVALAVVKVLSLISFVNQIKVLPAELQKLAILHITI
jgi:hypothetical protein